MQNLKIGLLQFNQAWENKSQNYERILRLMKDQNVSDEVERAEIVKMQEDKKEKEKQMSHGELMKVR